MDSVERRLGMYLTNRGLRVKRQAHIKPAWTSIVDHLTKSTLSPICVEVRRLDSEVVDWKSEGGRVAYM